MQWNTSVVLILAKPGSASMRAPLRSTPDRSDAAYSILARMLAIRRDNLRDTIAALERRLPRPDQAELVIELA